MLLDLDFHRWGQPVLVLAVDTVIEPGLAVAGGPVAPAPPEFPAVRHELHHIVAWHHFGSEEFSIPGRCGQPDFLAAGIHAKGDWLDIGFASGGQPDGKRGAPHNNGGARLEQEPHFAVVLCRHQWLTKMILHIYHGARLLSPNK